jgi:hypothetical protein
MKLADRTTGDLLVLMITGTICGSVILSGAAIAIIKLFNPETNIDSLVGGLTDVIVTLVGLLAGFLAGRTDAQMQTKKSEENAPLDNE